MSYMYLIGLILVGLGTFITYKASSIESDKTIRELKDSLNLKNTELQKKQDENNVLSAKILEFQKKLDSNTKAVKEIAHDISKISINTNRISNIIKDEQRQKGKVEFDTNAYEYYEVDLGMVGGLIKKENLNNEETNYINETPFSMLIENDKLLVSLSMKDKNGNLIFDLKKGEWAINKNIVFSVNYDSSGIEVIDREGNIILQIDLIKNNFKVVGTFYEKDGVTLLHPGLLMKVLYSDPNYDKILEEFYSKVVRKFVHYGENYLGKRLNQRQ